MSATTTLFQAALGLPEPWQVTEVRFDPDTQELHLSLDFPPGRRFPCPDCGAAVPAYDTDPARTWRHLNFFEHRTLLHARFPRTQCPTCGIKTVEAPWARPGSGFTLLFEAFVLLLARQMPMAALAARVGEHDTRLWRVLTHYVETGRAAQDWSQVRHLGIDETACRSGQEFVSLCVDLDQGQVLSVAEGHDTSTVRELARDFAAHHGEPAAVEAVCIDLSRPFQRGVMRAFPEAKVVFDHFHVVQLVNVALDQIRRAESKQDPRLKGTRYLWLKNPEHLTARQQRQLAPLLETELATAQAYQWKRTLQTLWQQPDRKTAARQLDTWCRQVAASDRPHLGPLKRAAKTLAARRSGILNYFQEQLSNGFLEGLNNTLQTARRQARGFRSVHYFATMIYLLGGAVRSLPT